MYRLISFSTLARVVVMFPMKSVALAPDQPYQCMPVSTTRRQARSASKGSMPSRCRSLGVQAHLVGQPLAVQAPALDIAAHLGVQEPAEAGSGRVCAEAICR